MSAQPKELKAGRYVLVRTLGEGSQGETYEAVDNLADRSSHAHLADQWVRYVRRARAGEDPQAAPAVVAIKCFRLTKAKAWKDVELAEREARTLASLDHPSLPKYVDHFEEGGALYLVMEKIEGESVAALREAGRSFSRDEVRRMLEDVGGALAYLHGRAPAVVHRDVKPGNVVRRPDGSFVLVDFGSVRDRLERGGSTVVGTFGYMAPEQFQGRALPRSDVYGLGATALAMLTGREPEELPHEGLGIDVRGALPSGAPASLVRALTAMLVPDPDRRVGSIEEALAIMRSERAGEGAPPRGEDTELERAPRRERRAHALARRRRLPLVARAFANLGLLVAIFAVTIAVGVLVPLLLYALSFLFGDALRRAARACLRASRRSQEAMLRASASVSGATRRAARERPRLRVGGGADRVRVHGDPGALEEERLDAWDEAEALEERERRRRGHDRGEPLPRRR